MNCLSLIQMRNASSISSFCIHFSKVAKIARNDLQNHKNLREISKSVFLPNAVQNNSIREFSLGFRNVFMIIEKTQIGQESEK